MEAEPHHVTGDGKYETVKNIAGVEEAGIRAYLGLHEAGGRGSDFFPKRIFTYNAEKDLYLCSAGETLRALGDAQDRRSRGKVVTYRARGSVCAVCATHEPSPARRGVVGSLPRDPLR